MKKVLYILSCAIFALSSCSKNDVISGQNQDGSYTFNVALEQPDSSQDTKATVVMARYILEMYEGSLSATPLRLENATGEFTVTLKKEVDYTCLFWADNGASAYDASSLKAVKQTTETSQGTEAYCGKVEVNSKTFTGGITLKRAVAELCFIDKNGLTAATNSLQITYPYASATLSVGDGSVSYTSGTLVRTIGNITPPTDATKAFATDFILAPQAVSTISGLNLKLNTESDKSITAISIRANFKTNITGEYQPNTPTQTPAKVGDFYYSDNTWSTDLDTDKTCIGVVFKVNVDGVSGKIINLTEPAPSWNSLADANGRLQWSDASILVSGMGSSTDGSVNTAALFASAEYNANKRKFPLFLWCEENNNSNTATGISWHVPGTGNGTTAATYTELKAICYYYAELNAALSQISGATLISFGTDYCYWGSEHGVALNGRATKFEATSSITVTNKAKTYYHNIRLTSKF